MLRDRSAKDLAAIAAPLIGAEPVRRTRASIP
jgi:hypothetical protein